jgi:hypothetical protein
VGVRMLVLVKRVRTSRVIERMDDAQKLVVKRAFEQWLATASANSIAHHVLFSVDLVPSLLAPLTAGDWAAAATCRSWLHGWKAKWGINNFLQPMCYVEPAFATRSYMTMVALPDGSTFVAVNFMDFHAEVGIVDQRMHTISYWNEFSDGLIDDAAASDDSLYIVCGFPDAGYRRGAVRRFELSDLAMAARLDVSIFDPSISTGTAIYVSGESRYQHIAYSPSRLFVVAHRLFEGAWLDEYEDIRALDPLTLTEMFRFGQDLNSVTDIEVGDHELYVATTLAGSLFTYSFGGEQLRTIQGAWQVPKLLCFVSDRIYLVESGGKRIIVLTTQAETLQVYTYLPQDLSCISSMWVVNNRMIAHGKQSDTMLADVESLETGLNMSMIALKVCMI